MSNGVDVVLVPPLNRGVIRTVFPPMGLLYIASYLESSGFATDILDYKDSLYEIGKARIRKLKQRRRRLIQDIASRRPKIIGIGCMTCEYGGVIELSKYLKSHFPDIPIILGGQHPTARPLDMLKFDSVDFVCIGEGEVTLTELTAELARGGKDFSKIDGLAWKKKGKAIINKERSLIENLDSLPEIDYHKVPLDVYTQVSPLLIRDVFTSGVPVFTSRGCPFNCIYCASKYSMGRKIRYFNPIKIVEMLEKLKRKEHINSFFILDDTFTMNKEHVLIFCRELIRRNLNLIWGAETRVNLLDEEMIRYMKKAGCIQVEFGLESGSDRILGVLKKGTTRKQIIAALDLCARNDVRACCNVMIGSPTETIEDIEMTKSLLRLAKPSTVGVAITAPYPKTELESMVFGKAGIPDDIIDNLNFYGNQRYNLSTLPVEELRRIMREMEASYRSRERFLILKSFFHPYYVRHTLPNMIAHPEKIWQLFRNGAKIILEKDVK